MSRVLSHTNVANGRAAIIAVALLLQVALLVYLAHVGSFVPARSAVIGLTDRILTRLPGMESVAHHTSSFMADLAQVGQMQCEVLAGRV